MQEKDTTSGKGVLNYKDFSIWLGGNIKASEGFYFRHDSCKNPLYELSKANFKLKKQDDLIAASKVLVGGELYQKIIKKFREQWTTVRAAFTSLDTNRTGSIDKQELRFWLDFWGMDQISEAQFDSVFNKLDYDRNGIISFTDLQYTIGQELYPREGLYFRQEGKLDLKTEPCIQYQCFQIQHDGSSYCRFHMRTHEDKGQKIYKKIFNTLGTQWPTFIQDVKLQLNSSRPGEIEFDTL
jgi:hypothetical protein